MQEKGNVHLQLKYSSLKVKGNNFPHLKYSSLKVKDNNFTHYTGMTTEFLIQYGILKEIVRVQAVRRFITEET